jgi:hypothetical protein
MTIEPLLLSPIRFGFTAQDGEDVSEYGAEATLLSLQEPGHLASGRQK